MPELAAAAIINAAGGAAAIGATAATAISVATYTAFVATSAAIARRQSRKAAQRDGSELRDRTQTARGSAEAMQIVLGRTRVGGVQLAPGWTHGANKEYWSVPVAFAGHTCESVDEVWFDDASIGALDGTTGGVTGGKYVKSTQVPGAVSVTGGAAASTYTLAGGANWPIVSVVVAREPSVGGSGQIVEPTLYPDIVLVEGTDYSLSTSGADKIITWITAQTDRTITVNYTGSTSTVHAYVRKFLGNPAGERDTELETYSGGEWTTTDVGNSIARLRITYVYDQDIYPSGPPQLSAVIKGAKLYDPRLDSTNGGSGSHRFATPSTWAWSRNPALAWAWYMTSDLGLACTSAEIDWPSVITAANVCDEAVPVDGGATTQVRYTCDGVLSTADTVRANVDKILSSMVGTRYLSGGKWYVRAGAYVTPTLDLTADDFGPGGVQVLPRVKRRELFNAVKGLFVDDRPPGTLDASDAGGFYALTNFPPYESATFKAQDNGELLWSDEIELPMTTDWRRAQRISKLMLYRARQSLRVVANFKMKTVPLQPGDTCRITLALNGWSNKVFRVVDRTYTPHGNPPVALVLQEEASSIYDWTYSEAIDPDPAPNTALPSPRQVGMLSNFGVTTGDYYTLPDGTVVPFCTVSWDAIADSAVLSGGRIELWWKRTVDIPWAQHFLSPADRQFRIEPVSAADTVQVYAWVINGSQVRTPIPNQATARMRADLPTGTPSQPNSANLLSSASFDGGVLGNWGTPYGIGGTGDGTINVQRHPSSSYFVSGSPGSVHISIDDAYTGTGKGAAWPSALIPVSDEKRYVGYAGLIGWGCDAFVSIQYYDINLIPMGTIDSDAPVTGVAVESATRRWNDPAAYTVCATAQTPPTGARYARVLIVAGGTWLAGSSKYVSIHKPYFGELPLGSQLPAWAPGAGNAVTTAQIAINSTYDVYRQVGSDVPITLPTGNVTELVSTFRLPVNSIGAPVDLSGNDVTVTVSFDLTVGPAASQADAYAIGQVTWAASGIAEQFGQARTLLRETLFIGASKTINCQMVQRFRMPSTGVAPTWEFYLRAGCKSVVPAAISTPEWGVEILKV